MSFINQQTLNDQLDLPIHLPRVSLEPNDSLVVSVFELDESTQKLTFKAVQLHAFLRDPDDASTPSKVDAAKGSLWFGVFKNDDTSPVLNSEIIVGPTSTFTPPETQELANELVINGPSSGSDRYTMKVTNNTTNLRIEGTLTGTVRIDLNAA